MMVQELRMMTLVAIGVVVIATLSQSASLTAPLSVEWCFTRGDGYYQNPYDCYSFVRCAGGIKYEFDCPAGTRWNFANNTCDHIYQTPCNTTNNVRTTAAPTGSAPYCPQDVADGYQRDPADCNLFYRCLNGVPYRLRCPAGQYYISYGNTCGSFEDLSSNDQSYCSALPQTTASPSPVVPVCPSGVPDGNQRDPTNCGRYYSCKSGVLSIEFCDVNTYFSTVWGTCVPLNTLTQAERDYCSGVLTTLTPTTPPSAPPCPAQVQNGTQRDASNCGRYFRCVGGTQTQEFCPQDLVYSPAWGACTPFNSLSQAEKDFCAGLTTVPPPTTPTPPPTQPVPVCPPEVVDGNQRDTTNCGRYYRCRSGAISFESCAQDLYFSPSWGSCVPFDTLSQTEKDFCATIPTRIPECPKDLTDGFQRDPQDCHRYYRCLSGTRYSLQCPAGLYFTTKSTTQPCDQFEEMSASDQGFCAALEADAGPSDVYCPPDVVGFQRNGNNCSQYIWCVNGAAFLRRCDSGLVYVTSLQRCSIFNDLSTTDKAYCSGVEVTTPAPAVPCPPSVLFAQVEHPSDCGKYYQCQNGVAREVQCGPGNYYSPQTFRCDPPELLFQPRYEQCLANPTTSSPSASIVCGGNNEGRLMDFFDKNCRRYFDCKLNQVTSHEDALECAVGTYFNVLKSECTSFENLPPTFRDYCLRV
ncbi:uncharacterized protein LOC135477231 isoform X2 [Liolophura sinensis]|uniref:uncharacterized protein LOC135477231 isoform X2 n=1 Tax=Liolophura sinensis TaxID=3198878 RepID=UPI003158BDF4